MSNQSLIQTMLLLKEGDTVTIKPFEDLPGGKATILGVDVEEELISFIITYDYEEDNPYSGATDYSELYGQQILDLVELGSNT